MEKIICAAIRDKSTGLIYSLPAPQRHHQILHAFAVLHQQLVRGSTEQGFLTSEGQFVNRSDAVRIAVCAGQVSAHELINPRQLYSEDVW